MATVDIAELAEVAVERPARTTTGEEGNEPATRDRSGAGRKLALAAGAILLAGDVLSVWGAFFLAHWVRFVTPGIEAYAMGLEQYARIGFAVGLLAALFLALDGWYDPDRVRSPFARLRTLVSAVSTALVLAVAASFFLGDERFSRLWFAYGWGVACAGLFAWRTVAPRLYVAAREAIAPADRVLIVGANSLGQELAREMAGRYRVVGYVDNGSDLDELDRPLLGPIARLEKIVQTHAVDEVVIALPADRREQTSHLLARGFHRQVKVKVVPDLEGLLSHLPQRLEVGQLGGRPTISFAPKAKVSWLKRAFDLLAGGLGLLAISPFLLAIALAVKLDSPGPVFYRQTRVGKDGRRFRIYKFRSMRPDADRLLEVLRAGNEADGPLFKMRRDPRVTRVGAFLRRWSLDELPQLINVVKGEMSLVGPRPPIPAEVDEYESWQFGRLRAVPGLTGLWQVSGRSDVSFHDMVRLDLHYIRNWTILLDLEILLRTVPAVLTSRGAY
jgi:exopolysaccharide biosynthesis polyprenyl glycosylphosphotransferase